MTAEVVVVGGGPAGLSAAIALRRRGLGVVVLEREARAGGIPRHADHPGFGLRDLHRVLSGPAYAERLRTLALRAGVELREGATVTGWRADGALEVTAPSGRVALAPAAVLLATGCRERPRAARRIPGTRPAGVMTTGTLQQLVHLEHRRVGERALVIGAEHVSFSAIETLHQGGARTLALVTEHARHQSLAAFRAGARIRYGTPVWTATRLVEILGAARVEAAVLEDLVTGARRTVACDTVVVSADWIPDHELAVTRGCDLDPGSRGPRVDASGQTSAAGVWAAGNLVHPAETADVAALGGRHVAAALATATGGRPARVPVTAHQPLLWVSPGAVGDRGAPPRGRFLVRARIGLEHPRLHVAQGERELWSGRLLRLIPGRSASVPAGWTSDVDLAGPPVEVRVLSARRTWA